MRLRFAAVDVEAARRADPRGASARVKALAGQALDELQFFVAEECVSCQAEMHGNWGTCTFSFNP